MSVGALSFASSILPTRVYEVAPHLTRVGIGAMYFGGIAANKDFFDGLPEEVQTAVLAAGKSTSLAHGAYVTEQANTAIGKMVAERLEISELPEDGKKKWVESLPNIVGPWLASNGEGATTLPKAYFAELRARGVTPLRDRDTGL
ncbi:extracellular solute-binding protein (family 7) [Rhizobium subbaraonis]|uniref:Extracellular solute-binding protein (Family 7) n=1 Tax=Rhizobium subbaraonis TaxID=908946 RepID=A0A285V2G7_9HYPH|nr:extracellular solute-binding protein (family 7) [Rhizobium subbaraonis]